MRVEKILIKSQSFGNSSEGDNDRIIFDIFKSKLVCVDSPCSNN